MWTMSSRRVLGGIEVFIGAIRVAEIRWIDDMTILHLPGHPPFEVPNTSQALYQMHQSLKAMPPDGAEVGFKKKTATKAVA